MAQAQALNSTVIDPFAEIERQRSDAVGLPAEASSEGG